MISGHELMLRSLGDENILRFSTFCEIFFVKSGTSPEMMKPLNLNLEHNANYPDL